MPANGLSPTPPTAGRLAASGSKEDVPRIPANTQTIPRFVFDIGSDIDFSGTLNFDLGALDSDRFGLFPAPSGVTTLTGEAGGNAAISIMQRGFGTVWNGGTVYWAAGLGTCADAQSNVLPECVIARNVIHRLATGPQPPESPIVGKAIVNGGAVSIAVRGQPGMWVTVSLAPSGARAWARVPTTGLATLNFGRLTRGTYIPSAKQSRFAGRSSDTVTGPAFNVCGSGGC